MRLRRYGRFNCCVLNRRFTAAITRMRCLHVPSVLVRKSGQEQYDSPGVRPRSATRYVLPLIRLVTTYSAHGVEPSADLIFIFSVRARSWRSATACQTSCCSLSEATAVRSGGGAARPSCVLLSRSMENIAPTGSQSVSHWLQFQCRRGGALAD